MLARNCLGGFFFPKSFIHLYIKLKLGDLCKNLSLMTRWAYNGPDGRATSLPATKELPIHCQMSYAIMGIELTSRHHRLSLPRASMESRVEAIIIVVVAAHGRRRCLTRGGWRSSSRWRGSREAAAQVTREIKSLNTERDPKVRRTHVSPGVGRAR